MPPQASSRRNMGSRATSIAMCSTLLGSAVGSSLKPSLPRRAAASASERPEIVRGSSNSSVVTSNIVADRVWLSYKDAASAKEAASPGGVRAQDHATGYPAADLAPDSGPGRHAFESSS